MLLSGFKKIERVLFIITSSSLGGWRTLTIINTVLLMTFKLIYKFLFIIIGIPLI